MKKITVLPANSEESGCGCSHDKDEKYIMREKSPLTKKVIYDNYILKDLGIEAMLASNANTVGLAMSAIPAAAGALFSVKDLLQRKMMEYKWKKKGCDQEINPALKQQCEIRHRNMLIASIARERGRCRNTKDPQSCANQIDNRIAALKQQNAAEYSGGE